MRRVAITIQSDSHEGDSSHDRLAKGRDSGHSEHGLHDRGSNLCHGSFGSYLAASTNTAVPYASTSVTPCITSVAS
jgi:hypothetical protein